MDDNYVHQETENTCGIAIKPTNIDQQVSNRTHKFMLTRSEQARSAKRNRIRQMTNCQPLPYLKMPFQLFQKQMQKQSNPFMDLWTLFCMADDFQWRQRVQHMQLLIKALNNYIQENNGGFLGDIYSMQMNREKMGGYFLQERIETMLHLSNKQLQDHLLLFVHTLLAYNKRIPLFNEPQLSDHLTFRHFYQKNIRPDVLWLLTRMSVSQQALIKVIKFYRATPEALPLLPILTIISNFIYEQPTNIIQCLIQYQNFQAVLQLGLFSLNYETGREAVLICNNLLFKSVVCKDFVLNNSGLVAQIRGLKNEESEVFQVVIQTVLYQL